MKLRISLTTAAVLLALATPAGASSWKLGKYDPGYHNVVNAVYYSWCHHRYTYCSEGHKALEVAYCESKPYYTEARNGEHLGLFQMGEHERRTYGHGPGPWQQSEAAHKYYLVSGWSPWYASSSCWA